MFDRFAEAFNDFFDWMYQDYEKWMVVPAVILLLALSVIGYSYMATGETVSKGIDFTGGSQIQVEVGTSTTVEDIEQAITGDLNDTRVRTLTTEGDTRWVLIETTTTFSADQRANGTNESDIAQIGAQDEVSSILTEDGIDHGDISIESIGGEVSDSFLLEAQLAVGIAFLIMSTVIFVAFRSFVPSMAVILAAFTDIVVAIAGMNILGIDLTLGSLAALLMLIGYSVDTDIVLSTRVLKQKHGDLKKRVKDSITTGTTMTAGGVVAFIVLFTLSSSPILDQIAAVMIIGLIADAPITWLGNAVILKMHSEGRL